MKRVCTNCRNTTEGETEYGDKKTYKFGLRKKLVLFTTVLAVIAYTTSALFIDVLFPMIQEFIGVSGTSFEIITYVLGVIWSGILAFLAAGFIIMPLQKLEHVTLKAAHGEISEDVELPKDDEISSLGIAFNHMLFNLRDMVHTIDVTLNGQMRRLRLFQRLALNDCYYLQRLFESQIQERK